MMLKRWGQKYQSLFVEHCLRAITRYFSKAGSVTPRAAFTEAFRKDVASSRLTMPPPGHDLEIRPGHFRHAETLELRHQ